MYCVHSSCFGTDTFEQISDEVVRDVVQLSEGRREEDAVGFVRRHVDHLLAPPDGSADRHDVDTVALGVADFPEHLAQPDVGETVGQDDGDVAHLDTRNVTRGSTRDATETRKL